MILPQSPARRLFAIVAIIVLTDVALSPFLLFHWPPSQLIDSLSEVLRLLLLVLLLMLLPKAQLANMPKHFIEAGLILKTIAGARDAIDEFSYISAEAIDYLNFCDLLNLIGLILITLGLAKALKMQRLQHVLMGEKISRYRDLSRIDALTGLFNRGHMDEYFAQLMQQPHSAPFSLLVIDVDNFKQLNDNYGHPQGDVVLKRLAQNIKQLVGSHGECFRFGGEEFVIYWPQQNVQSVEQLATALLQHCHYQHHMDNHSATISVSIGIASRGDGESTPHLLARADQALYQAKRSGKNRYCLG